MGRPDPEMRSRLLFDPEGGPAPILEHLDDPALLGRGGQPDPRARRDDHIFLPSHQHRPAVCAGGDDVARLQLGAAHRGGGTAALLHLHFSSGLRHSPVRHLREGGMAPEKQQYGKGAQEHFG